MIDLNRLLKQVQKPARYTGGELNSVVKDNKDKLFRFAFCFPDLYEVGMSHLGMKILYHMLNEREDIWCERVFAPWIDMEQQLRDNNIPLYALESKDPINSFNMVGFTLQYEMSYTNIINMLDLGGIPLLSSDRGEEQPIICAGGPCAFNPEPLADIIDIFMIGEGEEVLPEVIDLYKKVKEKGGKRAEFLKAAARIEGVYVPSLYNVEYNDDQTIKSITPICEDVPVRVKKRIIKDLDKAYYPNKIIVPFIDIVHNRMMLEVFRGCIRGCRFCQAGVIYRPVRERAPKTLIDSAKELINSTGYEELSLASLSTSDYTQLEQLTDGLLEVGKGQRVNLALPSLRVDSFSLDLMKKVQSVRKSGLTFAPEAGTQRMRDIINKGVTEQDLIRSSTMAFEGGWNNIKLYFMIGLPFEEQEDVEGIADLAHKVVEAYYSVVKEKRPKGLNVTVSVSSFVPKPFTPFQWEPQNTIEVLREKQRHLRGLIKTKKITYNWHESKVSFMEGVFSRGDRRLSGVLIAAHKAGCKFDGWDEFFSLDRWLGVFSECGIDPAFYANRRRETDELLPWDIIDAGVTKQFLVNELEKSKKGSLTPNCREGCSGCGAATFGGGVCHA